jgi:hypothetical protein
MKQIKLGKRVRVSDPCYGTGVWCSGVVDNVKEGTYNVDVEISDEGVWGNRVKSLIALHSEYTDHSVMVKTDFEVGVDSGQAGIYDEDYYNQYHTYHDCDNDWYEEICELTNPFGTKDEKCVVSSSGFGDGGYDCYLLKDENNEVVGIQVVFINDDEEDDDYNEYEEDDYDEYEDEYEEDYEEDEGMGIE